MHCRIQAWDDEAVELQSPMWFRVSFRSNYGDFVELEGDEILDFCSALLEYGDLYIFEVFVVSRNTCTFVDGNAIRGLLQGLLNSTEEQGSPSQSTQSWTESYEGEKRFQLEGISSLDLGKHRQGVEIATV